MSADKPKKVDIRKLMDRMPMRDHLPSAKAKGTPPPPPIPKEYDGRSNLVRAAHELAHSRGWKDLCRPHLKLRSEHTRNRLRFIWALQSVNTMAKSLGIKEVKRKTLAGQVDKAGKHG